MGSRGRVQHLRDDAHGHLHPDHQRDHERRGARWEGSAVGVRSAASHLGSALGVVFTHLDPRHRDDLLRDRASPPTTSPPQQTLEVVDGIIDGATSEELSSQYSVPVDEVDAIDDDLAEAMIDGLHAVVVGGALISLLCAAGFNAALRRQVREASAAYVGERAGSQVPSEPTLGAYP